MEVTAAAADHTYQGTAPTRIEGNSSMAREPGAGTRMLSAIVHPPEERAWPHTNPSEAAVLGPSVNWSKTAANRGFGATNRGQPDALFS